MKSNIILNTDSYKASHWSQYPQGTRGVYSYIESRGGDYSKTVFFGLQAFIQEYLGGPILKAGHIEEASMIYQMHGVPFNKEGWTRMLQKHGGNIPVVIKAVPEGTVVPVNNVLATIENTDEEFPWITSYLETALLRAIWYPTTVATKSWHIKQIIKQYLEETGDVNGLDFKLHDFGARGVSSLESASLGGMAHLVNFKGTDTVAAILAAKKYYGSNMAGFSIPAAEHSTITSWGREGEEAAYENMIKQYGGEGKLFAVVSDSYNIFSAVSDLWGKSLRQKMIDSGATLVVRPDSGDPESVVMRVLHSLSSSYGETLNSKGFKVLNHVRVIQGDGVTPGTIRSILAAMKANGFSADNIAFGMGGALLQGLNRDSQKFAMKASAVNINGKWIEIAKDPITDSGKRSKLGRVTLYRASEGGFYSGVEDWMTPALESVFVNGYMPKTDDFESIRARANVG